MTDFSWLADGSIIGLYLLVTMVAGIMVRKYVGRVEHFLVAGREINVYLGIASLAATEFGIVACVYGAQNGYRYGFSGAIPGLLQAAAMFLIGVTGFCIKPLRDSGVMTIPELFEKRFGPKIRWAAGVVIVLALKGKRAFRIDERLFFIPAVLSFCAVLFVFLFTPNVTWLINGTTINRTLLIVIPVLTLSLGLLFAPDATEKMWAREET